MYLSSLTQCRQNRKKCSHSLPSFKAEDARGYATVKHAKCRAPVLLWDILCVGNDSVKGAAAVLDFSVPQHH